MDVTVLCELRPGPGGKMYVPGDRASLKAKHLRPLVETGKAWEGHIAITESAARLVRKHNEASRPLYPEYVLGPDDVMGTGEGGRILLADVEKAVARVTGQVDEEEEADEGEAE